VTISDTMLPYKAGIFLNFLTLSLSSTFKISNSGAGSVVQVVEYQPIKSKALSSNSSTTKINV
jgi:hypothetical protein